MCYRQEMKYTIKQYNEIFLCHKRDELIKLVTFKSRLTYIISFATEIYFPFQFS